MNALRHGLRARRILLPDEDPEELDILREHMVSEFAPVGFFETELVERLVRILWRERRLERVEVGLWDKTDRLSGKVRDSLADVFWVDGLQANAFRNLVRYASTLSREFRSTLATLLARQRERQEQATRGGAIDARDAVVQRDAIGEERLNESTVPSNADYEDVGGAPERIDNFESAVDQRSRDRGMATGSETDVDQSPYYDSDELVDLNRPRGYCFGSPRACRRARMLRAYDRINRATDDPAAFGDLSVERLTDLVAKANFDDLNAGNLEAWNELFAAMGNPPEYVCACESAQCQDRSLSTAAPSESAERTAPERQLD